MEDLPKNIRELAETLKKSGLAVSDVDAIEKAKASLGAEDLLKKTQNMDNYYKEQENRTVSEAAESPKEEVEEEKTRHAEEPQQETKETIEIKELDSSENKPSEDAEEE